MSALMRELTPKLKLLGGAPCGVILVELHNIAGRRHEVFAIALKGDVRRGWNRGLERGAQPRRLLHEASPSPLLAFLAPSRNGGRKWVGIIVVGFLRLNACDL